MTAEHIRFQENPEGAQPVLWSVSNHRPEERRYRLPRHRWLETTLEPAKPLIAYHSVP